ncbi:hypothetical protein CMUS01_04228 [Colletotrichum musicola]|uniref:Uncharacterized protein n=1 Tax=Colletotrichum musicola TaxID=2175873 RepID=A0A8H6KYB3_9PEZI|nr:hypothetical protein CMUS01_04228 [Colletotrichum musicola]
MAAWVWTPGRQDRTTGGLGDGDVGEKRWVGGVGPMAPGSAEAGREPETAGYVEDEVFGFHQLVGGNGKLPEWGIDVQDSYAADKSAWDAGRSQDLAVV